ncbi:PAS domain S-box protein [Azohydromonas aeria]|uniref:PAS domain S-box protein n=1 Tax=Azohydromonas aeria TaxID=2590212 RepID=UPI0012F97489|nr:PAS domain S-box protein [Azohydromonas aeria]
MATLEGGFIGWVAWRCWHRSGEALLRWVTLAFAGFTLVYSLHGFFTPLAHHNLWLFILYGPASRVVMGACLLAGLLRFGVPPDPPARREDTRWWLRWFGLFLALNVAVGVLAYSPLARMPALRLGMEGGAIALYVVALGVQARRGLHSPLMKYAALAFAWFAFASLAFILARPWNHQWWLAHAIFAAGCSVLGYGILRVFLATQSFEHAFSLEALTEDLTQANARLRETMERLEQVNRAQAAQVRALEASRAQFQANARLRETMERLEQVNRAQAAQVRALEASRAQFAAFFELSPDAIFVVDAPGLVLKANRSAEVLFGYGAGELDGLQVERLMPEGLRVRHQRSRQLHQASPVTRPMSASAQPLSCLRRDGSVFSATISLSSLVYEGRPCTVTFVRDVTLLLRHGEERRLQDERSVRQGHVLEQLAAQLPFVVFQLRRGPNGRYDFPYMSPKSAQLLGLDEQALRGNVNLWFSSIDPAALAPLLVSLERSAAERSAWTAHWTARHADGSTTFPCLVRCAAPVPQPDGSLVWTGTMRHAQERLEDAGPLPLTDLDAALAQPAG